MGGKLEREGLLYASKPLIVQQIYLQNDMYLGGSCFLVHLTLELAFKGPQLVYSRPFNMYCPQTCRGQVYVLDG